MLQQKESLLPTGLNIKVQWIRCDSSIIYTRQNIYSLAKLTRMMEFISGGVTCLALSMAPMTCC